MMNSDNPLAGVTVPDEIVVHTTRSGTSVTICEQFGGRKVFTPLRTPTREEVRAVVDRNA